ncbi:CsbD family protein [Sinorhizobium fredii]|uniref:CsbD family protein n=1 Tax=Rhizobium fredii TaxID=380 RepID=UPI0004BBA61F|nr:CsbD family protein [Sinorhizobium fredii]
MDWNRVEGNWKQFNGLIKEQWGKLTDDDLDQIGDKRDQLEGKIQENSRLEKDRAKRDIEDWYSKQDDW